ncbi:MAG TPA: hypothetical protein VGG78_03175, partial [Gemmatimonadaceae bacterium]
MGVSRVLTAARRLGPGGLLRLLLHAAGRALYSGKTLVVFRVTPDQLNAVAPLVETGEQIAVTSAPVQEFPPHRVTELPSSVAVELRGAVPGQRLHWLAVNGRVASCGFSAPSDGWWPLLETRSRIRVRPGEVCLTTFETFAPFRGRGFYAAVLTQILRERFGNGASAAYIWCAKENIASYRAIKRVGFQEVATHTYRRVLGLAWKRERPWMTRPRRIAHVLPWPSVGGTEHAQLRLAKAVEGDEFTSIAVCLRNAAPVRALFEGEGIPVVEYDAAEPSYRHPVSYLRASAALARQLRAHQVDLVHFADVLA